MAPRAVAAAIAAAWALAAAARDARAQPANCASGASAQAMIAQENTWCGAMELPSQVANFETCCAAAAVDDSRRLLFHGGLRTDRSLQSSAYSSDAVCRTMTTDAAYCDENISPGCTALLGSDDTLTLSLTINTLGAADQCCRTCQCIGDPSCISFDGTHDEWVLCDSRRRNCHHAKKRCKEEVDHAGNTCKWVADSPEWENIAKSGSPCQPDFAVSGYASMTMYDTGTFKLDAKLGERGIIVEAVVTQDGISYTLDRDACFQYDPRTSSSPEEAWSRSIPSQWAAHTPNDVEILWRVFDANTGITADIYCTKMAERNRLDIRQIIEPSDSRIASSSGFCATGVIGDKAGSTAFTSEIWQDCLEENLPNLLMACKSLVSKDCTDFTLNNYIDEWCENADVGRTSAAGADRTESVQNCKDMLHNGTKHERTWKWTELVCEANGMEVEACKSEISQFGWDDFLTSHSDGMIDQGNPISTCESDPSSYTLQTNSCEPGVSIEYQDGDGNWHQVMFIPSSRPPCNNEIVVHGDEHPELFTNPIRLAQCSVDTQCLASNECTPATGFQVALLFQTDNCPTAAPTLNPTTLPTVSPTTLRPSAAPTPAPTLCEEAVIAGKLAETLSNLYPSYTITGSLFLYDVMCTGNGPSNVMQVGCDESELVNMYVKDCTSELVVTVETTGGTEMCEIGEVDSEVNFEIAVAGNTMQVLINGEEKCSIDFQLNQYALSGSDVCVYTSSPNYPAAPVCLVYDLVTSPLSRVCQHESPQQTICTAPPAGATVGTCETMCPALSDLISDDNGDRCRSIAMPQPYCDKVVQGSSFCDRLKDKTDGKLVITLDVDQSSDMECCQTCSCFGDPECVAFDGSSDNWLLCDARDATSCEVQEGICLGELDHMGNACVWDAQRAAALVHRTDIGAIGSPCQANWTASGLAEMVMYERAGFKASITMGERGVIETLELAVDAGTYTLVADKCFANNWEDGWTVAEGSSPLSEALTVSTSDGPGNDQRTVLVSDINTGVFVRVSCIERTSQNKQYTNARLNVQNLVETDTEVGTSGSTSGFCARANAQIDKGESTYARANEVHEQCQQAFQSANLLCRALSSESCSASDIRDASRKWCELANVYPSDPDRVKRCNNYIRAGDKDTEKVAQRWAEMYCMSVSGQAPAGTKQSLWVQQCVAQMQTDGYEQTVALMGDGTVTSAVSSGQCGADDSFYGKRSASGQCTPGISIEYQQTNGVWAEEMFIPLNLLPCNNQLEVSAKNHYNLFIRPIRFTQCSSSLDKCPADVSCMPLYDFRVDLMFSQDAAQCEPDN